MKKENIERLLENKEELSLFLENNSKEIFKCLYENKDILGKLLDAMVEDRVLEK